MAFPFYVRLVAWVLVVTILIAVGASGQDAPWQAGPGRIDAVTYASTDLDLAFPVPGIVAEKAVVPGTFARKSVVLMRLVDKVGAADVENRRKGVDVAELRIKAAEAELEQTQVEHEIVAQLNKAAAATDLELARSTVAVNVRTMQVELAKMEHEAAETELQKAIAQHDQYTLLAPIDGIIEAISMREDTELEEVSIGEAVRFMQPVIRLVNLQTLLIDASVPTLDALALSVGDHAWVQAMLAGRQRAVEGKIIYISQVTGSTDKRLVRIEVPNQDGYLGAGWNVVVFLNDPGSVAKAPIGEDEGH